MKSKPKNTGQPGALPNWQHTLTRVLEAPDTTIKILKQNGEVHHVRKNDQFKGPDGQVYQVCVFRGRLKLWPINGNVTYSLGKIKKDQLVLLENRDQDAIYSEVFINKKLTEKPLELKTDIKLSENEKKLYENKIMDLLNRDKENNIQRKKVIKSLERYAAQKTAKRRKNNAPLF